MPFSTEFAYSIRGAWRLARYDAGGLRDLNLTVDGFWRSFVVVPLLLPVQLALNWLLGAPAPAETGADDGWLTLRSLEFVLVWLVFVASMAPLSRLMRLSASYPTYIIAFNWAQLLQTVLVLPVALIVGLDYVPEQAGTWLLLLVTLAVIAYDFVVARLALGADILTAIGIVIYALLLKGVIGAGIDKLVS